MSEIIKDVYENFKDMVLKEYEKGNVVFMTHDGPMTCPLSDFIKQPAEGLLYDLNRDKVTVLTMIKEHEKWVNDYAVAIVITELHNNIKQLGHEKQELLEILKPIKEIIDIYELYNELSVELIYDKLNNLLEVGV